MKFSELVCIIQNGVRKRIVLESLSELNYLLGEKEYVVNHNKLDILQAFNIREDEIPMVGSIYLSEIQTLESFMTRSRATVNWRRLQIGIKTSGWFKQELESYRIRREAPKMINTLFQKALLERPLMGVKKHELKFEYKRFLINNRPSLAFRKAVAVCEDRRIREEGKKRRELKEAYNKGKQSIQDVVGKLNSRISELSGLLEYSTEELIECLSRQQLETKNNRELAHEKDTEMWEMAEYIEQLENEITGLENKLNSETLTMRQDCEKCQDNTIAIESALQCLCMPPMKSLLEIVEFFKKFKALNEVLFIQNIICVNCETKVKGDSEDLYPLWANIREINYKVLRELEVFKHSNFRQVHDNLSKLVKLVEDYKKPMIEKIIVKNTETVRNVVEVVYHQPIIRIDINPVIEKKIIFNRLPQGKHQDETKFNSQNKKADNQWDTYSDICSHKKWFGFNVNRSLFLLMSITQLPVELLEYSTESEVPKHLHPEMLIALTRICALTGSKQAITCARRFGKQEFEDSKPLTKFNNTFGEILGDRLEDNEIYASVCSMLAVTLNAKSAWKNKYWQRGVIEQTYGINKDEHDDDYVACYE